MLSTIIYRSHISDDVAFKTLGNLAEKANQTNEAHSVTGILLFNGTHFFQVLEGPEEAVLAIYEGICRDPRHHNLVELMRDYAPARRFGNVGMELFDLREYDREIVLQAVLDKGTSKYQLTYDDRALQFLRVFVEATERENYFEIPPGDSWEFIVDNEETPVRPTIRPATDEYSFAFQPIIDPLSRQIVSLEAVMRPTSGASVSDYFAGMPRNEMYEVDLKSKQHVFAMAKQLGIDGLTLSINLLPMSLAIVPDAVDFLLQAIEANGLVPEQIVVEVTENGALSRVDEFEAAIKKLKASGISLAIDGFGAGSAGLVLLTQFQPDKIKIDGNIIADIHKSGPKQAIVQAILKFCSSLQIAVIAEGVNKPEEWMWLESAGVCNFQGALFAPSTLNTLPVVAWPEKLEVF
ncbi:diguanylate phosphodiesterase [Kalamiella sp. sgz302252]|uniref:diguanylate phosphodiesterase n=1 Tax=Pantoea sp. sgz302252 TaxID=3341827 RepID=UPI0036D28B51